MQTNRLGWFYQPKSPIFISGVIVGILLVASVGGWLIYKYNASGKEDRETIAFGVSIVGATLAIYGLLRGADSIRQANAEKFATNSIAFVQRWNSPSYLPLKTSWRQLNEEMDSVSEVEGDAILRDDVAKRSNAVEVLNFFEEMATGINSGALDSGLLRRYFETVVTRAFDRYEYWIRQHRIRRSASGFLMNLKDLRKNGKSRSLRGEVFRLTG